MTTRLHRRGQLLGSLDALGDHLRLEVIAQVDEAPDQREAARPRPQASAQLAVELDDTRVQVGEVTQVGVARAQIVDDQVDTAGLDLVQHLRAQIQALQRHRLGELHVDVLAVLEDRIVGLDEVHVGDDAGDVLDQCLELAFRARGTGGWREEVAHPARAGPERG